MKERVIIDVDTGIDDALAVLLALKSKRIMVEGITTGYGAVSVEQATSNTLGVIEIANAGYDVPVAAGAVQPLKRKWNGPVSHIHGNNGIGDCELSEPRNSVSKEKATDFIIRKVNENVNELVIICTARLTNLAIVLKKDPTIIHKVKRVVMMGGAIRVPGNITPYAEANIYDDPEAAQVVFKSGLPITMVGLDVTLKAVFHEKDMNYLKEISPMKNKKMIDFIEYITSYYANAYRKATGFIGCPLHDPLAVAVVIDPSLVRTEDLYVTIETENINELGATRESMEIQPGCKISVCVDVDEKSFIKCLIDTFSD